MCCRAEVFIKTLQIVLLLVYTYCRIKHPLIDGFGFRYYNLDAYHKHKMEKEMKKGVKKVLEKERTVFNDEEQRRYVIDNPKS